MDQLTYRSGKWDIITATLNNNILIYCAPVCSVALSHSQVTAALPFMIQLQLCSNQQFYGDL